MEVTRLFHSVHLTTQRTSWAGARGRQVQWSRCCTANLGQGQQDLASTEAACLSHSSTTLTWLVRGTAKEKITFTFIRIELKCGILFHSDCKQQTMWALAEPVTSFKKKKQKKKTPAAYTVLGAARCIIVLHVTSENTAVSNRATSLPSALAKRVHDAWKSLNGLMILTDCAVGTDATSHAFSAFESGRGWGCGHWRRWRPWSQRWGASTTWCRLMLTVSED